MYALAAAREAAGLDIRTRGMAGRTDLPPLRVYTSDQAHSSVEKACIALGLGQEGLRKIPTDAEFRMRADLLAEAVAADVAAGVRPIAAVATVGTTSTTSIDPVAAVADVCERHGMWLHVDAAYGGAAAIVPEMRHVLDGCDRADSLVVNPHKWLFTPVDCSLLYTARPDDLQGGVLARGGVPDDAGGRRRRQPDGLRALARPPVPGAQAVDGDPRLRRRRPGGAHRRATSSSPAAWRPRSRPSPAGSCSRRSRSRPSASAATRRASTTRTSFARLNTDIIERVNADGRAFISHTDLGGRYAIRVAIGNMATTAEHVDTVWELVREAAAVA